MTISSNNLAANYTSAANTASRTASNPRSSLKADDFIALMVQQLQSQDPLEPASNEQLLSQLSQIGQLQSSQDLQASLKSLVLQNNLGAAGNMMGKVVKGLDEAGAVSSGTVTSVRVQNGNVLLELDSGKQLQLARVTEIANAATRNTTANGTFSGTANGTANGMGVAVQ